MRIDIVTLFPELCEAFLRASILGRAAKKGLFEAHCHQIRDYTLNKQRQTDDYPYGGGCGMVLYAQPIADCLRAVQAQCQEQGRGAPHIVFLTAAGRPYTEADARRLAGCDALTLVCGHYEGIDERVIEAFADEELSIGDYVLTGGELPALVVADSVLRLQPGVLAEAQGYQEESYWDDLLEYPQYTRPEVWEGRAVPPELLTGDHARISTWRAVRSKERTIARRPDLYNRWCQTHPLPAPKWRRGEQVQQVRTPSQWEAAARLWQDAGLPAEQLQADRDAGWAFYLHSAAGVPDALAGVCRETGELGRLYVAPNARRRGIGGGLLQFARKKLPDSVCPTVWIRHGNAAAHALCTRLGYRPTGRRTSPEEVLTTPGVPVVFLLEYALPAE